MRPIPLNECHCLWRGCDDAKIPQDIEQRPLRRRFEGEHTLEKRLLDFRGTVWRCPKRRALTGGFSDLLFEFLNSCFHALAYASVMPSDDLFVCHSLRGFAAKKPR